MAADQPAQLKTIWIWPSGMFPRRVIYWLKAKALSRSQLYSADNEQGPLNLIAMVLDMTAGAFVPARPGLETRPEGCTMPVIRVSTEGPGFMIRQSSSVLEYLEECYPASQGYIDLSGGSAERRARVRDIVHMVTELTDWLNVDLRHTTELSLSWSGMTKEQQVPLAGEDGQNQCQASLRKLEGWVRHDVMDRGSLSLAGVQHTPTLADFALAGAIEYAKAAYGRDLLHGFDVLTTWLERYASSPFYVNQQEIAAIERDGFDILFKK